jgi:hypothetical protein
VGRFAALRVLRASARSAAAQAAGLGSRSAGRPSAVRASVRLRVPDGRLDGELHAHDGLDAGRLAGSVEAHGAVEALVVGDGQRRHAHTSRRGDQLVDARGTVAEREVRVHVQVDEAHFLIRSRPGSR